MIAFLVSDRLTCNDKDGFWNELVFVAKSFNQVTKDLSGHRLDLNAISQHVAAATVTQSMHIGLLDNAKAHWQVKNWEPSPNQFNQKNKAQAKA
jgi:hypothetical protein